MKQEAFMNHQAGAPFKILQFRPLWLEGRYYTPEFSNSSILYLFKRKLPKSVSFRRAYTGWRASGAKEEKELGESRAFIRWLHKHHLSVEWSQKDFNLHPVFNHPQSPKHDPDDEMSQELSFAIRPVMINERRIKLYVKDEDILGLINMTHGEDEDFLSLVSRYVTYRLSWEKWRAPAQTFYDWVIAQGRRPLLAPGQIGFLTP
jgi:hypothetical protein